jgi:hypothetical protein
MASASCFFPVHEGTHNALNTFRERPVWNPIQMAFMKFAALLLINDLLICEKHQRIIVIHKIFSPKIETASLKIRTFRDRVAGDRPSAGQRKLAGHNQLHAVRIKHTKPSLFTNTLQKEKNRSYRYFYIESFTHFAKFGVCKTQK